MNVAMLYLSKDGERGVIVIDLSAEDMGKHLGCFMIVRFISDVILHASMRTST